VTIEETIEAAVGEDTQLVEGLRRLQEPMTDIWEQRELAQRLRHIAGNMIRERDELSVRAGADEEEHF
jgi:hypothetical protein